MQPHRARAREIGRRPGDLVCTEPQRRGRGAGRSGGKPNGIGGARGRTRQQRAGLEAATQRRGRGSGWTRAQWRGKGRNHVEMESGRWHRVGCSGERRFVGGVACEVDFFLRERAYPDGRTSSSYHYHYCIHYTYYCIVLWFPQFLLYMDIYIMKMRNEAGRIPPTMQKVKKHQVKKSGRIPHIHYATYQ